MTTSTTTPRPPQAGDTVQGTYFGVAFSGTVRSRCSHTTNWKGTAVQFAIDLIEPVHLGHRTEHDSLMVCAASDGTALPSSAGTWGELEFGDHVEVIG